MTLTVRLDPALEEKFSEIVRAEKRTKSEVVTDLLQRYVEAREARPAYEIALDAGVFELAAAKAPRDLARNHKGYLAAALKAKHRR